MKLTIKQSQALDVLEDKVTTEILFGGGAGGGKSLLGCFWILKCCLKYRGTRWLIGRSELKNLRETTLNTFFEVCHLQGLISGQHYLFNQQHMTIKFFNGSEILLKDLQEYPSDPNFDSLGSLEITGAFVDEVSQITERAWNLVKSRIRYKLDLNGLFPKILGTCNPNKGFLYNRFYKPSKDGNLSADKVFIQSLLSDNPHISKFYEENLSSLDTVTKERLLFGNWEYDDDASALIRYDKILDIFSNNHVKEGFKCITADIARFGDDKTVIMVWSGLKVFDIVEMAKMPLSAVAAEIKRLKDYYHIGASNIIVDETGVGGGVVDILKCKGFVSSGSPLEWGKEKQNYVNLKSQCYFMLADHINAGKVYVKTEDTRTKAYLIQELEQVKQKDVDKDGKLAIIPKEKVKSLIGRSPDYSDALMMRMFFELKPVKKPQDWSLILAGLP